MKFFKFTLLLTSFICLTFSCSKDDNNSSGSSEDIAKAQNETENRTIPTSEIESGVRIEGATSKPGLPPSPNGSLDFQISTDKQEAFQEAGFDIQFSTTSNIEGAYILFQDSEGNKLNNYLDVPLSSLQGKKSANKRTKVSKKHNKLSTSNKVSTENDYILDVDFDNISPGTFCYEICLYDDNGNISAIQNICIEVEAWGGNSSIVGKWIFDRTADETEENGSTSIDCESGETITVNYRSNNDKETWILVLNADGTYYETYEGSEEYIDYDASRSSCSAVYETSIYEDKYSGNWAYNEDKETLTIIDFKYEDLLDASENETYPDGSVYFDGINTTANVVAGELVIVDYFDNDTETLIFKKN